MHHTKPRTNTNPPDEYTENTNITTATAATPQAAYQVFRISPELQLHTCTCVRRACRVVGKLAFVLVCCLCVAGLRPLGDDTDGAEASDARWLLLGSPTCVAFAVRDTKTDCYSRVKTVTSKPAHAYKLTRRDHRDHRCRAQRLRQYIVHVYNIVPPPPSIHKLQHCIAITLVKPAAASSRLHRNY